MSHKFSLGWKKQDKPTPRERMFVHKATALPSSVDLMAGMGPMLNQGNLGSCGPNTFDELLTYDQIAQNVSPLIQASRLYIYYWVRQLMGTFPQDSGVDNATMMQAAAQHGTIPESLMPYSDTDAALSLVPTAADNAYGAVNHVTQYAGVVQTLPQMQATLASLPGDSSRPFMFGFSVFEQIMSDQAAENGILTTPTSSDSPIGGHDVTFLGYNTGTTPLPGVKPGNSFPPGYFKFRNHWVNGDGTPWGDGGYGYCPFDYATGPEASDFYVVNVAPNSVPGGPTPTPIPTPVPAGVIAAINAAFAQVESQFARVPSVLAFLKQVQQFVIAYMKQAGYSLRKSGTIPPSVIQIIDGAFLAAESAYPMYAPIIALVKGLVDQYLPMV